MGEQDVEVLAIGSGPSNLAVAVAMEELAPPELAREMLIVEQHTDIAWQRGMLLPWTQSQVSFLKDLVTRRNPRSRFSFLNYLHANDRLDEFINLGSFTPYRVEISAYLNWVARSLAYVQLQIGRCCVAIEPGPRTRGTVDHWVARFADGSTVTCRHVLIGSGRDAYVPPVFDAVDPDRLVHSTRYAERLAAVDPTVPLRVAVIGGAQSAAEMLWETYQNLPLAQCTMIMRSIGLSNYESSKFTNELYYASFVDDFHAAAPSAREQLLAEMHRTNYSGLAPGMLETLYRQMYLDRFTGSERLHMLTMSDVTGARMDDGDVVLTLTDRRTGDTSEHRFDMVMLGTGFVKAMPKVIRDLADAVGLGEITVSRHYRMDLPVGYTAACYLQGVNETTHGIADSLMSVLAVRAEEIVTDLLARRGPHPSLVAPRTSPESLATAATTR